MLPLLLVTLGVVALGGGLALLRSLGPGYRIGRILSTAPRVSVAEALRIATSGERRYVAIEGRIDSEEEFEDSAHRPLVLRRTRVEAQVGRRWSRVEEGLEVVAFDVRDGLDAVAIDSRALGEGLVVIPRESRGLVRDVADRLPAMLPADAPARVIVDQVSSVEHATVLGWPTVDDTDRAVMTAGIGRPLILTTLELPEAMRVLARGERLRPRLAAASLIAGVVLVALGLVLGALTVAALVAAVDVPTVLAADPSGLGSAAPSGIGGDTRSSGAGPGLVGAPGAAILGVALIAVAAVAATLVYVRATAGRRPR